MNRIVLALLLFFLACSSPYYEKTISACSITKSPCYIIFLVDARHLDYRDASCFLRSVAKHPSDGSKNSDVGHAWIYLKKDQDILEGGVSGETGIGQPRYIEGVVTLSEKGDPNPARYFWTKQRDGFFQSGSGGHTPTFAAKVNLTDEEYDKILNFICSYSYHDYSLIQNNCASFLEEIAALIGLPLDSKEVIEIPSSICVGNETIHFWNDPCYHSIVFSSPDRIERGLLEWVKEGRAEPALAWYKRQPSETFSARLKGDSTTSHWP